MIPKDKETLRKLVTDTTVETYEDLSHQLIKMLDKVYHDPKLSDAQKNDEVTLNVIAYIKSCTNEILIDVLAEMFDIK